MVDGTRAVDPDARVDRRDRERDVAHVGRERDVAVDGVGPTEVGLRSRRYSVDQLDVVLHLRVVGRDVFDRRASRRSRARRPRSTVRRRPEVGEFVDRCGPGPSRALRCAPGRRWLRPRRATRRRGPARRRGVLTQQPDRDLRDGERVSGVDAELGRGGGVRLVTGVANRRSVRPRSRGAACRHGRGVHHHRRVHAVERPRSSRKHLAAAAFLGRRADHGDGEAEVVDERRERERRRRPRSPR